MRTIHKYVLNDPATNVPTFERVKWLHVDNQHESITVWAEVNTLERECTRTLYVVGTGQEVPREATRHIGSAVFRNGQFVFHVYAGGEQ
jgi:hypothetical protein